MSTGDLIIGGVSAAGSIGASVVALYLAGRSDGARRRERQLAAFAQARLVLVEMGVSGYTDRFEYLATVYNHSREPILDVELKSVLYMPISQASFVRLRPDDGYFPVLMPGAEAVFAFTFEMPYDGENLWSYRSRDAFEEAAEDFYAVVQFTDADETYWQHVWSAEETKLTRLAHGYLPRDVVTTETERGVRSRVRHRVSADELNNPFTQQLVETPWWRSLLRLGRKPTRSSVSLFTIPPEVERDRGGRGIQ